MQTIGSWEAKFTKIDPLGLTIFGNRPGLDVACVWDFCWILFDKINKEQHYCFGKKTSRFAYSDGDQLDFQTMHRLSLSVEQLKRIFFDPRICTANGYNAEISPWIHKFKGISMDTFLHKNRDNSIVTKTTTKVVIADKSRWEFGSVPRTRTWIRINVCSEK